MPQSPPKLKKKRKGVIEGKERIWFTGLWLIHLTEGIFEVQGEEIFSACSKVCFMVATRYIVLGWFERFVWELDRAVDEHQHSGG